MRSAKVNKKTTLWLGSDDDELEDGHKVGMQGYGFDVSSEDNMVVILGSTEGGDNVEVFIMRDLWPKIRAVMDRVDKRFPDVKEKFSISGDWTEVAPGVRVRLYDAPNEEDLDRYGAVLTLEIKHG